jgi:alpha-beta hydrolase superfamily lysophospholipase
VVLCPALGLEEVSAHRSYRHLAERLTALGLAVVRFDYHGTGNSAGGSADPGRVEAWRASIRAAVDYVRRAGAPRVVVVGLRVGATLAACEVARGGDVDALVLWDPCASGRSYLREQRALGFFSLGREARDDGSVEVPGIVYGADTVADLTALDIASTEGPLADRVLVLVRPERAANKHMAARLAMDHVEWGDAVGQADMVDVEPFAIVEPVATIDAMATWISDVVPPDTAAFSVPVRRRAVMAHAPDGDDAAMAHAPDGDDGAPGGDAGGGAPRAVVERIVTLGSLGLFGVVCEPEVAPEGPAVVLLNAGVIDHVGPSRLWVEFARRWAAHGVRVLRFDLSGLGDSPCRPGQAEDLMYPPEAFDDLSEVVRALSPDDPSDVVLAGLCSGGYHSVEGGIALGVRGVCLINPILTAKPSELVAGADAAGTPRVDPRRRATTARRHWVRALPAHDLIGGIVDRLPDPAWWVINRVAVENPPAKILERLVDNGVDTYIVCGEPEARTLRRGQTAALRRLARSGRFHLEVVPGIDHELFARRSRDLVAPMVTAQVLSSTAPAASAGRPAPAEPKTAEPKTGAPRSTAPPVGSPPGAGPTCGASSPSSPSSRRTAG